MYTISPRSIWHAANALYPAKAAAANTAIYYMRQAMMSLYEALDGDRPDSNEAFPLCHDENAISINQSRQCLYARWMPPPSPRRWATTPEYHQHYLHTQMAFWPTTSNDSSSIITPLILPLRPAITRYAARLRARLIFPPMIYFLRFASLGDCR